MRYAEGHWLRHEEGRQGRPQGLMPASSATRRGKGAGHGGPAAGAGWGGPARGASASRLKPRGDEDSDRIRHEMNSRSASIRERAEEVAEQMRQVLYQVALTGEAEASRINAADKLLDRLEGKPVVKQDIKLRTTNPDDLTDEELAAIAARGRRATAGPEGDPV